MNDRRHGQPRRRRLPRMLAGTVRSASLEDSPLLGTAEFEDALVNACWGVMQAAGPA